jgi:hypothetical protein
MVESSLIVLLLTVVDVLSLVVVRPIQAVSELSEVISFRLFLLFLRIMTKKTTAPTRSKVPITPKTIAKIMFEADGEVDGEYEETIDGDQNNSGAKDAMYDDVAGDIVDKEVKGTKEISKISTALLTPELVEMLIPPPKKILFVDIDDVAASSARA